MWRGHPSAAQRNVLERISVVLTKVVRQQCWGSLAPGKDFIKYLPFSA